MHERIPYVQGFLDYNTCHQLFVEHCSNKKCGIRLYEDVE
jgi:hypothetical protein